MLFRSQQVRKLANTFVFDVHDSIRDLPGATKARELIVKTGLEYLDSLAESAQNDPSLQSELGAAYARIGEIEGDPINANLGKFDDARKSLDKASQLLEDAVRESPDDVEARKRLVNAYFLRSRFAYGQRNWNDHIQLAEKGLRIGDRKSTRLNSSH